MKKPGIKSRSFWALMVTQFLGAANDNAFKLVVTFVVLNNVITGGIRETAAYMSAVGAVFVFPFLLFSTFAGDLADRLSKRTVVVWAKVAEIIVMALAIVPLSIRSAWMSLGVLFLMGTQSTFFSPAKYGILPEILPDEDLSEGNGIIQMLTDVAIITGMVLGTLLVQRSRIAGFVFVSIAIAGTVTSLFVGRVPPAASGRGVRWNFIGHMWGNIRAIRADHVLFLSIIGASYFWLMGACFQINFPVYGKSADTLNITNDTLLAGLIAVTALGIGSGAFLAGMVSGRKVEFGLIPLGAVFMAIFSLDLALNPTSILRAGVDVFLLGFGGGFYVVPLSAFIQQRAPVDKKGMVLATNNFITFSAILLASGLYFVVGAAFGVGPSGIFLALSVLTVLFSLWFFWRLPQVPIRSLLWFFAHSTCRLRAHNPGHIPIKGPGLLVCRHVCGTDSLLVSAGIPRLVRFVLPRPMEGGWLARRLAALIRLIHTKGDEHIDLATGALKAGELVGVFGEDEEHGSDMAEALMKAAGETGAPIIPVHLEHARNAGRRRQAVRITFGEALPPGAVMAEVHQAMDALGNKA